jgi:hypothetical protein
MLLSEGVMAREEDAVTDDGQSAGRRQEPDRAESAFRTWRRSRPFIGGVLLVVSGIEMFFSGQLDFGELHIQLGIEGLQATIIPILLVLLGILAVTMPAHHVFYGVIALAVALYSLVGVNLGGFIVGMLLGCVGGILVVAWMPKGSRRRPNEADGTDADAEGVDA